MKVKMRKYEVFAVEYTTDAKDFPEGKSDLANGLATYIPGSESYVCELEEAASHRLLPKFYCDEEEVAQINVQAYCVNHPNEIDEFETAIHLTKESYEIKKLLQHKDVVISLIAEQEDMNLEEFFGPGDNSESIAEVHRLKEEWGTWGFCSIQVSVSIHGIEGKSKILSGNITKGPLQFIEESGYFLSHLLEASDNVVSTIQKTASVIG